MHKCWCSVDYRKIRIWKCLLFVDLDYVTIPTSGTVANDTQTHIQHGFTWLKTHCKCGNLCWTDVLKYVQESHVVCWANNQYLCFDWRNTTSDPTGTYSHICTTTAIQQMYGLMSERCSQCFWLSSLYINGALSSNISSSTTAIGSSATGGIRIANLPSTSTFFQDALMR